MLTFFQSLEAWQDVCSAANLPQGGRYKEFFPLLKAAYNVRLDDGNHGDGDNANMGCSL